MVSLRHMQVSPRGRQEFVIQPNMTLDLAALVPPSLAPSCAAMAVDDGSGCARACRLAEPGGFDRALSAFATAYDEPDRAALVSLWSMYYLAALIVPPTAALLCCDRVLPVGFAELGMTIDPAGLAAFRLPGIGCPAGASCRRFDTLVDGHLAPFVTLCAARAGVSPRVFWSNAAVMLDWALKELGTADTVPAARAEAEALLDGSAGACRLAHPLRGNADGTRTRRVCCLRYRLPGVADCGGTCPRTFNGREAG